MVKSGPWPMFDEAQVKKATNHTTHIYTIYIYIYMILMMTSYKAYGTSVALMYNEI